MNHEQKFSMSNKTGFSLIEVVLAIGIFLVTVLALVGLLGPTLQSVDEVEKTDEVSSDREYDQCVSAEFARDRTWRV